MKEIEVMEWIEVLGGGGDSDQWEGFKALKMFKV